MFKRFRCKVPMNLQKFAEGGSGDGGGAGASGADGGTPPAGAQQTPQFDYDKLASLIAGKQTVTEESVLKGYFRQQGLSKEQMEQAIASFKQQQAANQPDIVGMQNQIIEAQAQLVFLRPLGLRLTACSIAESCSVSAGRKCSYNDGCFSGNRSKDNSIHP